MEDDSKVILIYHPHSTIALIVILLALMAVTFIEPLSAYAWLSPPLTVVAAIIVAVRILFMHKVNREVQQAMKDDKITVTGGKLSLTNPLTFTISKT
jgi:uncharacterized membrane-anchored protein